MKKSTLHHHPYWLEQLDAAPLLSERPPLNIDVLIVGAGYTGLSAAINTARGGRSTVLVDAEDPGFGCSTRNGGQVSTSVKPSLGIAIVRPINLQTLHEVTSRTRC